MSDLYYFAWQIAVLGVALGGDGLDFTALVCEEPEAWKVQHWQDGPLVSPGVVELYYKEVFA